MKSSHSCLTLIGISGDKLVRATELVKLLSLEKSMKGAIKLVTALKLPNLAERFSSILEVSLIHSNKVQCTESISIHCHIHFVFPVFKTGKATSRSEKDYGNQSQRKLCCAH